MHPKTIEHLILVDFQEDYSDTPDYYEAFDYVVHHLFPKAKKITILYNGLEFDYFDDEIQKETTHVPETFSSLVKHFEESNVVGLTGVPRIVNKNAIIPLTRQLDILPKTFYFVRPWMNLGIPERQIIKGLRSIIDEDADYLLLKDKVLMFPEWFDELEPKIGETEKVTLVGGSEQHCMKELEYLLMAYNIEYSIDRKGVYGKS